MNLPVLSTTPLAVLAAALCSAWAPAAQAAIILPRGQGAQHEALILPSAAGAAAMRMPLATDPMRAAAGLAGPRPGGRRSAPVPTHLLQKIVEASALQGLDPYLVKAVVRTESAFVSGAVSPKGARGLMQVMPGTAKDMGLKDRPNATVEQLLQDPWVSLLVGTKYLAWLLSRYGRVDLALAAYNAGPDNVERVGQRVPRIAETQAYVKQVLAHYQQMRRDGTLAAVLQQGAMGVRS